MHNYKELKVWQKGMDLVVTVYKLTRTFPKDELFGLTSQLRRAAVSISLNIAEGAGRETDIEFARFLDIALGSTYESIVALSIAQRLGYCNLEESNGLVEQAEEIARMLTGLIKHYAPNRDYLK
ncbi:MAG: four helix bundle protein [Chloroflexi bacterium]|nr:four helix bundle protein [Chloroflexota bacterium]